MTLVDLLAAYAGAATTHRRATPEIEAVALVFPDGRRMILLERTYRGGVGIIRDPTDGELAAMREAADLWELWNSDRKDNVGGLGVTPARLF
jgi:hypothetical protein